MDWLNETEKLTAGIDFFKAEAGTYKIKFLDDGVLKTTVWQGKEIPKIFFKILVQDKEQCWSVTKGISVKSLYGQLVLVGKKNNGLKNLEVTLLVKGSGKEKDYTIIEAVDLIKEEIKQRKAKVIVEEVVK